LAGTCCEGATINAYLYRAFLDAAYLGREIDRQDMATTYETAARDLHQKYNEHLWNGTTYRSKVPGQDVPPGCAPPHIYATGEPTAVAAMLALHNGLVPPDRLASTRSWLLERLVVPVKGVPGAVKYWRGNEGYSLSWVFDELYAMDTAVADKLVLDIIRHRCGKISRTVTPETLVGATRPFHNYGAFAALPLSTRVLGVRCEAPVWEKRISIEPRLGDLEWAKGTVVTEHGPVATDWKVEAKTGALTFALEIPAGISAEVSIPLIQNAGTLVVNGVKYVHEGRATRPGVVVTGRYARFTLEGGKHTGQSTSQSEGKK
jgi:hypothetical protein